MANSRAEKPATGHFSSAQLLQRLSQLPKPARYWVGFSGGADSTALLLAMHELRSELTAEFHAIHFNHGLQAAADKWQTHCQSFCDQRRIPLHIQRLELNVAAGQSPEEQARLERYAAIVRLLNHGEIYLTAHHADDNAETFFLNLMRGSGMDGLAAIPPLRKIGNGWVARPLLAFRRDDLEAFLHRRGITWLEDPSNKDLSFDRNYLRNKLLPDLDRRWPGVRQRLSQSAKHARTFTTVLSRLLASQHDDVLADCHTLATEPFLRLEPELQAILLRQWLRDQEIVCPPRKRLNEFLLQLNSSAAAAKRPELRWARHMIKRHGNLLWLHQLPVPVLPAGQLWPNGMRADLGPDFGTIGLSGDSLVIPTGWELGPRGKAARMRLHVGGPRRKLKELMRECGVPPWLRMAIPVLYWHGEAAALGDWLFSAEFRRFLSDHGTTYAWRPGHPLLCKLQSVSVRFLDRSFPGGIIE